MTRTPSRLGILTGAQAEARVLRALPGAHPLVACSGADAARARTLARDLVARGATALVSFGLAGGLAAGRVAGTLLLPSDILLCNGSVCAVDPTWRGAVLERAHRGGLHLSGERIACTEQVLATPAQKQALTERSGAVAADMESEAVASAARESGLPFLVLRAVADPWHTAIPSTAFAGLAADGALRPRAVAARLLREPWHFPGVVHLARDSVTGLWALRQALVRMCSLDPS